MITANNITTIYVSQERGNDSFNGFRCDTDIPRQGPLKTIEMALRRVKWLRTQGYLQPITISVLDEEYFLTKPIVIDTNFDSMHRGGAFPLNITIAPYTTTCFIGAHKLTDFKMDSFNGQKCISVDVSDILNDGGWFTDFYIDSHRASFTKYPSDGTLEPLEVENKSIEFDASSKWFIAKEEDLAKIKGFKNFDDCFISYNHYWIDEHTPIHAYDVKTGKIEFEYASRFALDGLPKAKMHYIIENVAEAFNKTNEWYLDRSTSRLYYIPADDTANHVGYAPATDKFFIIEGSEANPVDNVIIKGFSFKYSKGDYRSIDADGKEYASDDQSVNGGYGAISAKFAKHIEIRDCAFEFIGLHAIRFDKGCFENSIIGNTMQNLGGGGIVCAGGGVDSPISERNGFNTISDNIIKTCGLRYFSSCGILMTHSYSNTISHNDISDLFYTGISVGWEWGYNDSVTCDNIIEYNRIQNLGKGFLSDMGGIYLLGKQNGTIVRNNIISDVKCAHYGGWAIYLDEGSSYILVENNICYNLSSNGFHIHYGAENTIRNNIFAFCDEPCLRTSKDELNVMGVFENNILVANGTGFLRTGYDDDDSGQLQTFALRNNIYYDMSGDASFFVRIDGKIYNYDECQQIRHIDEGSIIADPGFKDLKKYNFELNPSSIALKMGFKPINTSEVGIHK